MRVLIVCAGNTCRSPLAEDIARRAARARGLDAEFASAGLIASDGDPAAPYAIELARARGGDLSAHESQSVTRRLVAAHDLVLVMEPWQQEPVELLGGRGKTRLLDDAGVADPLEEGTRAAYERTYAQLEAALQHVLDDLPEAVRA